MLQFFVVVVVVAGGTHFDKVNGLLKYIEKKSSPVIRPSPSDTIIDIYIEIQMMDSVELVSAGGRWYQICCRQGGNAFLFSWS